MNDYIQAHLSEKITVAELAQIAQLSPSHFLRTFRTTTGQSPHQYLLAARLAHARQLIVNTDLPLELVAKTAGFHSNSHMTAMMKKAWNVTPTLIRMQR